MDMILLWVTPVVLLGLLAGVWLLLRPRPAPPPSPALRARTAAAAAAAPVQVMRAETAVIGASAVPSRPASAPGPTVQRGASSVAAQREAAVEALRQARRRAAADAARWVAARQARPPVPAPVRASVAAPAALHPPLVPPACPPAPSVSALAAAPSQTRQAPVLQPGVERLQPALRPPLPPAAPLLRPGMLAGPLTVLVVDDSKVVRIKTSRLLEKHGYRVLLADDGLTALASLDAQAVDLVITDVEMPGLDGFGLTQQLRGQPRWARLPVIMITSSDEKHRTDAAAVGVDVLLGKPYDEPALLAEVRRALGLAARRADARLALQ